MSNMDTTTTTSISANTYTNTSTIHPTIAPTGDSYDSNDAEPGPALRLFIGTFMLIVTLFVFSFAVWTYSKNLKRLFSACWEGLRQNGICCCFPCIKHNEGDDGENGGQVRSSPSSGLLNNIIFEDEEQRESLTESLLT